MATTTTTTTISTTSTTTTLELRDTQLAIEVLEIDANPELRDTQLAIEVLEIDANPELRDTQLAIEVLKRVFPNHDEDFSTMAIGDPPTGWTETWDTDNVDTTVEVAGKDRSLVLDLNSNNTAKIAVTLDSIFEFPDMEVLALVQAKDDFATLAGGIGVRISGETGTETGYVLFLDCANNRIFLRRYNNGISGDLANHSHTIDNNRWYWLRLQIEDATIKASIWNKHGTEPATWDIDYTDASPVTGNGKAGVCTFNADAYCDHLLIETNPDSWPISQPSYTTTTTTTSTSTTTTHSTTTGTTTTAEAGNTYSTNFSEHAVDTIPSDWTEIWEAPAAVITARAGGQYGNRYLEINHSTFDHYLAEWDDVGTARDIDVLAKVMFGDANPVSGDDYFKIVLRQTGGNNGRNGYELRVRPDNDDFAIYKWVSSVASQIGATGSETVGATWYWVRFQVIGNNLKAKIWTGQPSDEPGMWDIETTDSVHAGVYGTVGIGSYNGSDTRIDYFAVGVGGSDAPAPTDYATTTTTSTSSSTTSTGTTESLMEPATYAAVGHLQQG